jgi:hypothetical protein
MNQTSLADRVLCRSAVAKTAAHAPNAHLCYIADGYLPCYHRSARNVKFVDYDSVPGNCTASNCGTLQQPYGLSQGIGGEPALEPGPGLLIGERLAHTHVV